LRRAVAQSMGPRARGRLGARERGRRADRRGAAARAAPRRHARASCSGARRRTAARRGARDDDGQARLHRPRRRSCRTGRRAAAPMKLRVVTHAERDLSGKLPNIWPEYMGHDAIAAAFWPRLYEVYADFQLWVLDDRDVIGYACTLPVHWDGVPEERGIDWAMSNGVTGEPTTLCAIVAGVIPSYRGRGIAPALLRRMSGVAAAHGLDCMIAPVRPTWKERYPVTPMESYVRWRREDGFHYDPWIRTHERVGAEFLSVAPRSLTISGRRDEWERWTDLQFPEDGEYIVPG